jgi:hypothetical protein
VAAKMVVMSYVIHTIDESAITNLDGATRLVADAAPSYPCRRCLADAQVGETVLLTSADPFETESPYRSRSPIYLHADGCQNADGSTTLPPIVFARPQSIRAYDADAMMVRAEIAQGDALEKVFADLLADPDAAYLHVHNALPGCFNFRVDRA